MEFPEFATQKLLQTTGQSGHLTDREKHLIGLAVTTTRGCVSCTGNRLERAVGRRRLLRNARGGNRVAAAVNAGVTSRSPHKARSATASSSRRSPCAPMRHAPSDCLVLTKLPLPIRPVHAAIRRRYDQH